MNSRIEVRIDKDIKSKAMFVLKSKGKDLSNEVRKAVEKIAAEYEQKNNM